MYDSESEIFKHVFKTCGIDAFKIETLTEYNLQTGDGDAGAVKWTVQTLKNYFEDKGEA